MALTKAKVREILSKAGVDKENMSDAVEEIIEGHIASINVLREEADKYKEDAAKLESVQKELDELKAARDDGYKEKYETEHKAFEDFKAEQTAKETRAAKENAYRALLAEAGVEKRLDAIMKVANLDGIELNQDGSIRGKDKLLESIKTDWADFITTTEIKGAPTPTPPTNTDAGKAAYEALPLAEKMKYANEHPREVSGWLK